MPKQILRLRDLAGGVAHKGYLPPRSRAMPFPVVGHPAPSVVPPSLISTVTAVGTRVDGIFHQLLDNGGRPLDDLASRDLDRWYF